MYLRCRIYDTYLPIIPASAIVSCSSPPISSSFSSSSSTPQPRPRPRPRQLPLYPSFSSCSPPPPRPTAQYIRSPPPPFRYHQLLFEPTPLIYQSSRLLLSPRQPVSIPFIFHPSTSCPVLSPANFLPSLYHPSLSTIDGYAVCQESQWFGIQDLEFNKVGLHLYTFIYSPYFPHHKLTAFS